MSLDLNADWAREDEARRILEKAAANDRAVQKAREQLAETDRVKKQYAQPAAPKPAETRKGIDLRGVDLTAPAIAVDVQPQGLAGPKPADASLPPPLASDLNAAWAKADAEVEARKNAGKR